MKDKTANSSCFDSKLTQAHAKRTGFDVGILHLFSVSLMDVVSANLSVFTVLGLAEHYATAEQMLV